MKYRFATDDLVKLYTDVRFTGGHSVAVARAFRKVMQIIVAASDERDLYAFKSLRFEKLKGDRAHQRSLRLNSQWRLIVEIEASDPKNIIVVISIEDYH